MVCFLQFYATRFEGVLRIQLAAVFGMGLGTLWRTAVGFPQGWRDWLVVVALVLSATPVTVALSNWIIAWWAAG